MGVPAPPPPRTKTCTCGQLIWILPTSHGGRMPVDVGEDPTGLLLGVWVGGERGVRVMTKAELEDPPPGPRFTPHWATCPPAHSRQYRAQALNHAPDTWPQRMAAGRAGRCAACGDVFGHRYGPGPASPLCPPCRAEKGLPPVC